MKANENQNRSKGPNQKMKNGSSQAKPHSKGIGLVVQEEWLRRAVAKAAAETWWEECPQGRKVLAMTLADMMDEMTESKRIEIRLESGAVRARFIHILRQPEPGCVSAIVLPEAPRACN